MKDKRQIQSQYWVTIGYTLFVSIVSWLLASEWNKTTGILPEGGEVTVEGEMVGEKLNKDSFWAVITDDSRAEEDIYEVTDAAGKKHTIERHRMRYRQRHCVASGHVTDDKVHDRHAMQHFTDNELKLLESYMKENFPEDIPKGHMTRLHQHSDNASTHFKNTGAINYYTTLIDERGGPNETAFVYSFGAPGHGKGPYDGIGGRWKNKIDQAMSSALTKRLEFTESGYIQSVKDVFSALNYYFSEAGKKDAQLAGKNPIHCYKFFYYSADENPIQRPNESFKTLDGITKRYQICVHKKNVIQWRMRTCWCLSCMDDLYNGTVEWGDEHLVENCKSVTDTSVVGVMSQNMYSFAKKNCDKLSGPGVAIQAQAMTQHRNEIASKLTVGDFILFDKSGDEVEQVWLGKIMPNLDWGGQGVCVNVERGNMSFGGVQVGRGEVALYVMWYEKINVMSDRLEYLVSTSEVEPMVQNNRCLIPIEVTMHQMLGQRNPVPRLQMSSRGGAACSDAGNRRFEEWHNKELEIVWKMDLELRRLALSSCAT